MSTKISDRDFVDAWNACGRQAAEVARRLDIGVRAVYDRRNKLEEKLGISLPSAGLGHGTERGDAGTTPYSYNPRLRIDNFTGTLVSFSDCHWWPGLSKTLAFRALLEVAKEIKPDIMLGNGDLFDGARISRFGRSDWGQTPTVDAELEEGKERCSDIQMAAPRARRIRTIGNHDQRFDKILANKVSEMEGVEGFRLKDHLRGWEETMSVWINGHTIIKHRWHGGVHAAYNNALRSGVTMITGHTHELEVKPIADYRGRRYAAQDGTLADPYGPQFAYAEDNPTRACAGFVVVTFDKAGRVLQPELCECIDGVAWFRGQKVVSERRKAA